MIKYFSRCRALQTAFRITAVILGFVLLIWSFRIFPLDLNIEYEHLFFIIVLFLFISVLIALAVLRCVIKDAQEDLNMIDKQ